MHACLNDYFLPSCPRSSLFRLHIAPPPPALYYPFQQMLLLIFLGSTLLVAFLSSAGSHLPVCLRSRPSLASMLVSLFPPSMTAPSVYSRLDGAGGQDVLRMGEGDEERRRGGGIDSGAHQREFCEREEGRSGCLRAVRATGGICGFQSSLPAEAGHDLTATMTNCRNERLRHGRESFRTQRDRKTPLVSSPSSVDVGLFAFVKCLPSLTKMWKSGSAS